MDRDGAKCYPGTRTLSSETGLHRKTVEDHLQAAEREGWIQTNPEWRNGQRREWRATFPGESGSGGLPVAEGEAGAEDSRSEAKRERRTPGQDEGGRGEAGVLSPESGSPESESGSPGLHVGRQRSSEEDEEEQPPIVPLWRVWIEECWGGDTQRSLTRKRRSHLNATVREQLGDRDDPVEFFRRMVKAMLDDPWWGPKPDTHLPEKAFKNEELREKWAILAAAPGNGGGETNRTRIGSNQPEHVVE